MKKVLLLFDNTTQNSDISQKIELEDCLVYKRALVDKYLKSFIENKNIDIILFHLDPKSVFDLKGNELIEEIKEMPLILLVSSPNELEMQLLFDVPFSNYLIEPISNEQLLLTIESSYNKYRKCRNQHKSETADKLLEFSQRYKTIAEMTTDGFCYIDLRGKLLDVNAKYCEMSGYTYEELLSMHIWDLEATLNKNQVIYQIDRTTRLGKCLFESKHRSKDGRVFDVEVSGINFSYDIPGQFYFIRDISKRKRLETELKESERSKSVLLSNLPGMVYRCSMDRDWTMQFVSEGCYELTGYHPEDLLGNKVITFNDLIEPEYREHLWNKWIDVLSRKETFQDEYSLVTANGKLKWVWEQGKGIFDDEGNVIALEGFITDITERKEIEEAIVKAKIDSDNTNRSKSEFLANTSHELRTPLSSILGFSDILLEGNVGELNPKQEKYITTINKSGRMLLNLINNILDLSQIESGDMEIKYSKFDIKDTIYDVYSMMTVLARKKNIVISVDISIENTIIVADNTKLKEIIYNLMDNAIKFTPEDGKISVDVRQEDGNSIQISVTDTGIGTKKEDVERIFDPFYQADGSSTRKFGGTGLGLTIIRKFVQMHGGNIWVESEIDKGSTFSFNIPVTKRSA